MNPQIILPDGRNPYALLNAAELLFDQSKLPEDQRTFPLLGFQRTGMILKALYRYVKIAAPSQSGKTTLSAMLAATVACVFPGSLTLIMSAIEAQAERVLEDTRDKFLLCNRAESMREFSVNATDEIQIKETGSIIRAVPYSIKALTGNPAKLVILDEMAKFTREPATLYAEAVARGGRTHGGILAISSMFGAGHADPKSELGYTGNFFDYLLKQTEKERRRADKVDACAKFTYHVSPYLVNNIEDIKREMVQTGKGMGYFNEHYLCIPRAAIGAPVFRDDFSPEAHLRADSEIRLNPSAGLFMCFDPGLVKACVVGQVDLDTMRLIYLRAWKGGADKTWADFVQMCWAKMRREFPGWDIEVHCDVAGRRKNDQTLNTYTDVLTQITKLPVYTLYQNVEPGIQVMRQFMHRRDGFFVSKHSECRWLVEALSHGLVYKENRDGVHTEAWEKDGEYEHVGDAARYPVYSIMNGRTPEVYQGLPDISKYNQGVSSYSVNPWTGY